MAPTLTPLARKIITYLTLAFGCLVVVRYGISSPERDNSSSKHWSILINDPKLQLRGLIHVLKTYPDRSLPEVEDGALLTPYALGVREHVTPQEWSARILKTEQETPLTVFSKVRGRGCVPRVHPSAHRCDLCVPDILPVSGTYN